jgi:hypothetical protein
MRARLRVYEMEGGAIVQRFDCLLGLNQTAL